MPALLEGKFIAAISLLMLFDFEDELRIFNRDIYRACLQLLWGRLEDEPEVTFC